MPGARPLVQSLIVQPDSEASPHSMLGHAVAHTFNWNVLFRKLNDGKYVPVQATRVERYVSLRLYWYSAGAGCSRGCLDRDRSTPWSQKRSNGHTGSGEGGCTRTPPLLAAGTAPTATGAAAAAALTGDDFVSTGGWSAAITTQT